MYAFVQTRFNIGYPLSVLSRFLINLGKQHIEAANRVFRYLAINLGIGLTYTFLPSVNTLNLTAYSDSD